jgi:hypothetical protein
MSKISKRKIQKYFYLKENKGSDEIFEKISLVEMNPQGKRRIMETLKYFTMQKYNLQKNPLKETKILQDIITLELISSSNTSQNIIFQKSSYKNSPIT